MSEYRDDLAAARWKVERLERELAEARKPLQSRTHPLVWVLMGVVGTFTVEAGLVGLAALVAARRSVEAPEPIPAPATVEPAPIKKTLGAHWYPQNGVGPTLVDVNGDGRPDVVGLAWRTGHDEAAVHAIALDGDTLDLLWASEAFPSQWQSERTHLEVTGANVVVSDSRETLHVLDLASGRETRSTHYPSGPRDVCPLDADHVLVRSGWEEASLQSFDVRTGALAAPPKGAQCWFRSHEVCATKEATACVGDERSVPPVAGVELGGGTTWRDGDERVTLATRVDGKRRLEHLVGWSAKEPKKARWETAFVRAGDETHESRTYFAVQGGVAYALYQLRTEAGLFRLVARDAKTGATTWTATVPAAAEGTHVSSMTAKEGRVYVVANSNLVVFDGKTGALIKSVSWL